MTAEPLFAVGDAVISDGGLYRYRLTRWWGAGPLLYWVMLNPSTADAETDDPTITRCCRRAAAAGYDGICVFNLFALRAASPAALRACPDPVGPHNDEWLRLLAGGWPGAVVAAWGAHGALRGRAAAVLELLAGVPLLCLGTTAKGEPRHPLYVPYSTPLIPLPREES